MSGIQILQDLFYGKVLQGIELLSDDRINLDFENGSILLYLRASCCESLSFDDCGDVTSEAVGLPLVFADLVDGGRDDEDYNVHEWAFLNLKFAAGTEIVNVSYTAHNHHNGFYGGFCLDWEVTFPDGRIYNEWDRVQDAIKATEEPISLPLTEVAMSETERKVLALFKEVTK